MKYARAPPHLLRHTFAYEYLRANKNDLVGLVVFLGHESLNTTRHYTRPRIEDIEESIEKVRYKQKSRETEV